jgi:hypothetical protein
MYRWYGLVRGQPKAKWLQLLDPGASYGHRGGQFSYAEGAYEFFRKVYLKSSPPSRKEAYSALVLEAKKHGWAVPSLRTLERRLQADDKVPERTRYDADL